MQKYAHEVNMMSIIATDPSPNLAILHGHAIMRTGPKIIGTINMSLAPGISVHNWVSQRLTDHVPRVHTWPSFTQTLVNAIDWLHQRGIVHMDLHSGNIIVDPASKCLTVIDFGFACIPSESNPCEQAVNLEFSCPEKGMQDRGDLLAMMKDDAYSVGALAYYWYFGCPPFGYAHWDEEKHIVHCYVALYDKTKEEYPPELNLIDKEGDIMMMLLQKKS